MEWTAKDQNSWNSLSAKTLQRVTNNIQFVYSSSTISKDYITTNGMLYKELCLCFSCNSLLRAYCIHVIIKHTIHTTHQSTFVSPGTEWSLHHRLLANNTSKITLQALLMTLHLTYYCPPSTSATLFQLTCCKIALVP